MNKFYCKVVGEQLGLTVQANLLSEVVLKGSWTCYDGMSALRLQNFSY